MKKGIIISPQFNPLPNGVKIGGIDTRDLRKYLLYWDEIVLAESNIVGFASDDFDYLVSTGVGKREKVQTRGIFKFNAGFITICQQAAWAKRAS